ncbi:kelch-like protein 15 [Arctopsyche grandis]|uniref:kelch-like protein 15 n=1 Tax=Arctopsyche grandis TaxID=121162 RepID=UPI00406DA37E
MQKVRVKKKANTIDIFDGRNNSWLLKKNCGLDRDRFAAALVNNWILIIGGCNSLDRTVNNVDYIDLKDGQKHPLKPLNHSRSYLSAVTVLRDSSIDVYAIGGSPSMPVIMNLSSVERWNSDIKNWDTKVAPLLTAVCLHSASVVNDRVYVTGGLILKDSEWKSINYVKVYSAKTNSWSYCAPMNQARDSHSSVAIKGELNVGGGYYIERDSRVSRKQV